MSKRIGICVGHSRAGDAGARSADKSLSEWQYWKAFALKLKPVLEEEGFTPIVHTIYSGLSYTSSMSWVAAQLLGDGCDIAVELHFNAYNGKAEGFEALHWFSSRNGSRLAKDFLEAQGDIGPDWAKGRGRKTIDSTGRGGQFLRKTHCPAMIWEPFFGDNPKEWEHYNSCCGKTELTDIFVAGVKSYFGE
jgi:N-acetylmuramoyl-L-alanine amidase